MDREYSLSNRINLPLLIFFFLLSAIISLLISLFSALLGLWILPPYSNMFFVIVGAIATYIMCILFVRFSKTRNPVIARFSILCVSIISAFAQLAAICTIQIIIGENLHEISLGLNTTLLKESIIGTLFCFTQPGFVIKTMLMSGTSWIILMCLSFLAYLIIPQLAAEQAKKPFSEQTQQWMKKTYSVGRLELIPDREQRMLVSAMREGNLGPLLARPRYSSQLSDNYSMLVFYKVKDKQTGYVGIENFHQVYDEQKRPVIGKYYIIEFIPPIQLDPDQADQLEKAINRTPSSPQPLLEAQFPSVFPVAQAPTGQYTKVENGYPALFDPSYLPETGSTEQQSHYRRPQESDFSQSFQYYDQDPK